MAVDAIPGYQLIPSASKIAQPTNYITDFNFLTGL